MPDITYDVGRVSFVMKGAWNLATSYEKLDAVTYGGSLYIAKQDVPGGTAITNTTYWQLAAEKGDKGDTGGVDSVNGQQGDIWFPDSRQLISDGYTTDTAPFLMKGNDSDSDRFELAKKLGNTVAVNQLIFNGNFAAVQSWNKYLVDYSVANNEATVTITGSDGWGSIFQDLPIPSGHKYIALCQAKVGTASKAMLVGSVTAETTSSSFVPLFIIGESTGATARIQLRVNGSVGQTGAFKVVACSDLSRWYGSTTSIPSDLLSHPENWGRYYAGSLATNAGTLESADGTVLKSIGRNLWDEEWEVGGLNTADGSNDDSMTTRIRSMNYIPVIPNAPCYKYAPNNVRVVFYDNGKNFVSSGGWSLGVFNVPSNAYFIRFMVDPAYGTTYNRDITISLYYPGESGYDTYYPYTVLAEVDTGSEPLYGDGTEENSDVKLSSGEITRKRDRVDMGTLTYQLNTGLTGVDRFRVINYAPIKSCSASNTPSLKCVKFVASDMVTANAQFAVWAVGQDLKDIYFYTPSGTYASSNAFKTAMSGIMLDFPLATPTTEQGTAFAPIVATVKNGVLSWTNTKGIPVGHESHYFENLRKRVEDRLPDPPIADGTYRLTCTISGGVKTYSWEA